MSNNDIIYQSKGALIAFLVSEGFQTGSDTGNITGSALENEIAVWSNPTTIEGDSSFTWDGTLRVSGSVLLGEDSSDTVTLKGVDTGTDNTVLILNGSNVIKTDEIDPKVWAGDLVDYTGTPADNQVAIWTDTDTLEGDSDLTFDGTALTMLTSSATIAQTRLIEYTDGTDAITVLSDGTISLAKGNVGSPSVQTTDHEADGDGEWTKIMSATALSTYWAPNVVALVTINPMGFAGAGPGEHYEFIVTGRWARGSSTSVYTIHTDITVEAINSAAINGWDPTTDIILTYNGVTAAEIWIKGLTDYTSCDVTILGGTPTRALGSFNPPAWQIEPYQNSTWGTFSSLGTDVYGTWVSKALAGLVVSGSTHLQSAAVNGLVVTGSAVAPNIGTGTGNDVVILNSSGYLKTDTIDSKVWAGDLVDYSGTPVDSQLAVWTDTDTLEGDTSLTFDGSFRVTGSSTLNGYLTLPSGLSSSMGTPISNNYASAAQWVKVAEAHSWSTNDRASATIDVMLTGIEGTAEIYQARVHLWAATTGNTTLSQCQVDIIQDEGAEAWDTSDFVLTQKTSSTYKAELWVRAPFLYARCYATITNGSSDGRLNYKTDWYLTPEQTWGSFVSAGSDVTTTNVKKRFDSLVIDGDLTVSGNDIKNSAALTTITMNADGSITSPLQPMVYAFRNSEQDLSPNTSWETVIFNDDSITNDTAFDVGGDYNTSTGVFTAPADGKYLISVEVMLTNVPASTGYILLYLVTTKSTADSFYQYSGRRNPVSWDAEMDYYQAAGTWLANMADGDTAYVQIRDTSADSDTKIYGSANTSYTRIQIMKVA